MILDSQSFIGDAFTRPTPEVFLDELASFCLIITPWGDRSAIKTFQQMITDYYLSANKDLDITSPYPLLPYLSKPANDLRIAVILAVEWLCHQLNKDEYRCGIELFVAAQVEQELLWIKYGNPSVFFCKPDYGVIPVAHDISIPVQMSEDKAAPLPTHLLGFHPNLDVSVQGIKFQSSDKLILISKQNFEPQILQLKPDQWTLDHISKVLSKDSKDPFWVGLITL